MVKVSQLLEDEKLLRQTVGGILHPGPWEHVVVTSIEEGWVIKEWNFCRRCGGPLGGSCPVPDPASGNLAGIAEDLVKKVMDYSKSLPPIQQDFFERTLEGYTTTYLRFTPGGDLHNSVWRWFSLQATLIERIVCCLVTLGKAELWLH